MSEHYTSEITQFLQAYKKEHPDVEQRQRDGRARLWDKSQDAERDEEFRQANVPQHAYVYQNN